MDISTFKKKAPTSVWFTFDEAKGMRVELLYVSPEEYRRRMKDCTRIEAGREVLDTEKVLKDLASLIRSWEGFTLEQVAELIDIEIPEKDDQGDPVNLQALVTCSEENKIRILKESWKFKPFVEGITIKLEDFKAARRELERKNSGSSPSGVSQADSPATTVAQ